jgi:Kae1-associated kinase Bud32
MILKDKDVFFIDFGLGYISKKVEDKAVDLHLLKQALEAKHFMHWKELYNEFQESYSKENKDSKLIFERMIAIEKRGRYRH